MSFGLNDEQRQIQAQVQSLLAEQVTSDLLRKVITAGEGWAPSVWASLAELGMLGAGIPEAYGGVGLGPMDVAVIAQEVGRSVAPIPFFSSICLAAEAIMVAGTEAQKAKWLPKLATGEVVGCFAWTEGATAPETGLLACQFANDLLNGVKWPVADALLAQICIVAAVDDSGPTLAIVELDQPGVQITRLKGIDELRQYFKVDFRNASAEQMNAASGPEALQQILDRAAVYAAFEQVGGAEAALQMVRDYTLQRYIFGRQLASYQAVKHRLAEDFARIELAACNALYAAQALGEGKRDASAAAATARIGATQAYEVIARDNLQFHGGIGFTWEANCHFHYRRARMLALNLGSAEFWSDRLIAALDATDDDAPREVKQPRPKVEVDSPEDAAYREAARTWIESVRSEFRITSPHWETEAGAELAKRWAKAKYEAGYAAIAHPKAYGGAGGTRRQQQIFLQEEARAGLTMPLGGMGFGQSMAAITRHGTEDQRQKWETLSYSGEIYWCQLFSEPGAGSDLGAVRTRAVRQGDKWIVNGQKVWTSGGHLADFGILLARTDPDVPKHQGLSFFIIDMRQPGVTTRPIRQINGQSGFTETFFVDAEIPDENRLDAVGAGWSVAMSVLAAERTTTRGIGDGDRRTSSTSARSLIRLARGARRGQGVALDSADIRRRIAGFHEEAQGIKNFTLRLQGELARGGPPPLNLPIIKLTATNRIQQIQAFLMDLDEVGGIVESPAASESDDRFLEYVTSASSRIAGGADEVLRNQLAERALGMPGDIRADKDVPFSKLPA